MRRTLIVGQSHTEAVASALTDSDDIMVVNLNARDRRTSIAEKIEIGGYLPEPAGDLLVASMIGGNFYNTFGLIENSMRFEFAEPGEQDFAPCRNRSLVTYELIHHYFSDAMRNGFLRSLLVLRDHYGSPFVHVVSPPPIGDDRYIAENPGGYFRDKVHLGVAPATLRGKLYRLHTRVVEDFCVDHGISVLTPPSSALTKDGFLAPTFWKRDPTHANAAYGRLILEQLRELSS